MPPLDFKLPSPTEKTAGQALKQIADPILLNLGRRYERLQPATREVKLVLREPADHVTPEAWGLHPVEPQERMLWNTELMSDLKELTPQALLRDLHRPVRRDERPYYEPVANAEWGNGMREHVSGTTLMKREPWPEVRSSVLAVEEADVQRRFYYTQPWQPAKKDSEPRSAFSQVPMFDTWGQDG